MLIFGSVQAKRPRRRTLADFTSCIMLLSDKSRMLPTMNLQRNMLLTLEVQSVAGLRKVALLITLLKYKLHPRANPYTPYPISESLHRWMSKRG